MTYSVVIPAYNAAETIGRCLAAIKAGSRRADEIVVVDGGSTDGTGDIVRQAGARLFSNPHRHAAGGRNVGIQNATGEVVVFTDADCIPEPNWLARIAEEFENDPALQGVAGRMVALPPRTPIEAFWSKLYLSEILPYPDGPLEIDKRLFCGAFTTANCAYRKDLLVQLGGFDGWFGNNAEDIDLLWRAVAAGARLRYEPDIVISHPFPHTLKQMMSKNYRNGVSSSKIQKRYGRRFQMDTRLYRLLLRHMQGALRFRKDAHYHCVQLLAHLSGKYSGSLRFGLINL